MPDTLDQIQPLSEVNFHLKMLVYGPPGVGKTILAAQAPAPLLLDADGTGALSLMNHPELANHVRVLQIKSFNQMIDVLEAAQRKDKRLAGIETIIIDTLSELQKRHLDEHILKEQATNPTRASIPFQQDYKTNTEAMRKLVILFRDLDLNLICTAHETEEKDESTGRVKVRPFLTPKLASTMEGIFDIFGYMTADPDREFKMKRTLQIMPSRIIRAKTRIGGLPPIMENPEMRTIFDAKATMVERAQANTQEPQQPADQSAEGELVK